MMGDVQIKVDSDVSVSEGLSSVQFTCHCCYDLLIDPTTLTCGHTYCRHCLAMWWSSSGRPECPECRERWKGFPKVNILLRDAVEKLFPGDVNRRRLDVQGDPQICQVLQTFRQFGEKQTHRAHEIVQQLQQRGFNTGVIAALYCVSVVLSLYMWFSVDQNLLVSKPVSRWSVDDVTLWVEQLGDWTKQYRKTFRQEQMGGRLLSVLGAEDLSADPFGIHNPLHRRAFLQEIRNIKQVKAPGNLWEYKAANLGKSVFLLIGLRDSPRLTLLYLYLFDYDDTLLPFIRTSCRAHSASVTSNQTRHDWLSWRQWPELLAMYSLLPYQLLADYAWDWMSVHYWISWIYILNAFLLSLLEICCVWRLWSRGELMYKHNTDTQYTLYHIIQKREFFWPNLCVIFRTLPNRIWLHVKMIMSQWFVFVLLWPLLPHFICNFVFYVELYFNPICNIVTLGKILLYSDMAHLNI
ncbi:bifunctional apoptosis regulator-like [Triplophysa dalaica]|uniref:bifunctional apoptosis regulator-like n=1 Tax=Triplophysa dalaica TaxID=1582913 RepID=UPI0024E00ADA|nr:bifunctional apoptosis regulator-like [Triplophysa dalaica]XP_056624908.1 bifunctional apoptosis regulator-like [Triplophysa dalaica]